MKIPCRLIIYDVILGNRIKEKEFNSIYSAVEFGYNSNQDFNVIELQGQNKKLFYSGSTKDKFRDDFSTWENIVEEKELKEFYLTDFYKNKIKTL
jgi:hypothetical protein